MAAEDTEMTEVRTSGRKRRRAVWMDDYHDDAEMRALFNERTQQERRRPTPPVGFRETIYTNTAHGYEVLRTGDDWPGMPDGTAARILCQEPDCPWDKDPVRQWIYLDASFNQLGAESTPHGRLQKATLCHDVPWVALEEVMESYESLTSLNLGSRVSLTDRFKRRYCWFERNIRPGHNRCNLTAYSPSRQTVRGQLTRLAEDLLDEVMTEMGKMNCLIKTADTRKDRSASPPPSPSGAGPSTGF